jgi:hypothetical protein
MDSEIGIEAHCSKFFLTLHSELHWRIPTELHWRIPTEGQSRLIAAKTFFSADPSL